MASRDHRQAEGAPPQGADRPTDPTGAPERSPVRHRRELLGAAVGMTAASLATMVPAARAQTPGTTPGSTPGSTAAAGASDSGEKPKVADADLDLVRFLRSAELAIEQAYGEAMDSGRLKASATDQATTFRAHHRDYAERLADFAGSQAPTAPNPGLLASLSSRVAGAQSEHDLLTVLGQIEDQGAATYLWATGEARDWQLVSTLATIAPVDGQHATGWSRLVEPDPQAWLAQFDTNVPVLQTTANRWSPAQYPVGPS